MDFIPHDNKTIAQMLSTIGIKSLEELFHDIPEDLRLKKLNLSPGLSEPDLLRHLKKLSEKNALYSSSFLGAGCYYHYIPSLVDFVISRSEFYTSYTPYQAEASQGYLQAIYEYQTAITRITQMDVANASMYDGSTALAEAVLMASAITRKQKVILLDGIHPEYKDVLKTYCRGQDVQIEMVSEKELISKLNDDIAAVAVQSPNFFGEIEDMQNLSLKIKKATPNCLLIHLMIDPTCLGILKPPGASNVDIFVAEGQSFGISPSFGGPSLGIFTTTQKFMRKIPGRLVGRTKEINGQKKGFILTLQAREQHIRREKAISNICTNQALCMLAALVYLLSLGKTGLQEIAIQNLRKSNYLKNELAKISGYHLLNNKPTYNEFLVKCPDVKGLIKGCKQEDLLPPLEISKYYPELKDVALVCVTEMNSRESIEKFIKISQMASKKTIGGI